MIHIRKVILLVVMLTLVINVLLTTKTAKADDISGKLELEMREAVERRILFGYGEGEYRPEEQVTRGQFAAFMERALKLPTSTGSFKDVRPDSKLAPSIYAVANAGIMIGSLNNTFNPEAPITREQVAITIQNALTYSEMELNPTRMDFADANSMTSVTLNAVYNSITYKIISGYDETINGQLTYNFKPDFYATRAQAAAFIIRLLKAKETYVPPVEVDPNLYQLAVINNNELVKTETTYKTYDEALKVFSENTKYQGFYKENELIRVRNGFAFGNKKAANGNPDATTVYLDYNDSYGFRTSVTGIESGREMRYMGSNDKFIKVQVGATVGYVKHSETELVPSVLAKGRDSYSVGQGGTLIHRVYNFRTNSAGSYSVGPAPSFMTSGFTYYSHDGVHFMNDKGQGIGTHFPYFQFLSARSETKYSASEIDAYIMKVLAEKEVQNPTKYKDATKKSKLIGLGTFLKKLEDEKRINALMILSLAIHEGDYGMSETSQVCNNLFGLYKIDSLSKLCPTEGTFASPDLSALHLVDKFLNPGYIEPGSSIKPVDFRSNGAAFGNKTSGFNVRYATDPSWGSKAAGHMYSIDLALGGRDYKSYKKIALTKLDSTTNVRVAASSNSPILYTYARKYNGVYSDNPPISYPLGFPMTVVETVKGEDGFEWYKVFSDKLSTKYGYIRSDVVNTISY